ncbi:MAG: hypothetical protein ACXIUD_11730 [Mongoliitalea sp.]
MNNSEIIHLKREQINSDLWDECIENSSEGQIYALSWYLDIVSPGWEAFIQMNKEGLYESVIPLPVKKKYGILYLKQPFFCQQLGVFTQKNVASKFDSKSIHLLFQSRFRYVIDYTFNFSNLKDFELVNLPSTVTQLLNLNCDYETIQKGYNRDRKMNLKRAIRDGLIIIEDTKIDQLIEIFKNNVAHKIYGGVSEDTYLILKILFEKLREKGLARIFYTVNTAGEKVTSGLFTIWKNKIIYIFNASTSEGKKHNGNTLIIDHMIQIYSGKDYIFDFESADESFPWITGFYGSFGSKFVRLPQIQYNNLPVVVKQLKKLRMGIFKLVNA